MASKISTPKPPTRSYEDTLAKLESSIEKIEADGAPLEEALGAFEEGVRLTRDAQETIRLAEQRIAYLLEEGRDIAIKSGPHPCNED